MVKRTQILQRRVVLVVVWFLGLAVTVRAGADEGKIPITTTSEEAREYYIEGRDLSERFLNQMARVSYEKAVAEDPDFALARLGLSHTQPTTEDFFKCLYRAKALIGRVSEGEQLIILGYEAAVNGDPSRQKLLYRQLVTAYPNDERSHYYLGSSYFGQQDFKLAVEKFEKALEVNPEFPAPYNMIGYCYRYLGDYDKSESAFKKYIGMIPNDPNPYDSYAELLLKMGKYDKSIEYYGKALSVDTSFYASHVGIAFNLNLKGEHKAAREELELMISRSVNDAQRREALFAMAVSYVDEGEIDAALKVLRKRYAISEAVGDVAAMAGDLGIMAGILLESDRLDEARESTEKRRRLASEADLPGSIKSQISRGLLYMDARLALADGDIELAKDKGKEYERRALATNNIAQVWVNHFLKGLIAVEENDYDRAIGELEQANQQRPYQVFKLAQAHDAAGHKSEASELYAKVANFNRLNDIYYCLVRGRARQALASL